MATIFAVQDSVLDPANLPGSADLNRLINDGLSYMPDMRDRLCLATSSGGSLRITRQGSNVLVSGVRISRLDVSKNGVIQNLEVCYKSFLLLHFFVLNSIWIPPSEKWTLSDSSAGGQSVKNVCLVCPGCLHDGRFWFISF